MTWFKVDDRLHSHPKVLATSLAALGLWTVAGSWSSDHRTGGDVPDRVVSLLSRGASELADELVTAGLWRRVRGGYRFHDWEDQNPTREEAIAASAKKSSGGALGNHRRWHVDKGVKNPECPWCQDERESLPHRTTDRSSDRDSESGPNPPDPYPNPSDLHQWGDSRESARDGPPPRRCKAHADVDGAVPPCGACAEARRSHDGWQQANRPPAPDPLAGQRTAMLHAAEAGTAQTRATLAEDPDPDRLERLAQLRSTLRPPTA